MRVLHFGCYLDPARRGAAELLDAWPTLVDVAAAVAGAGAEVAVVHAGHRDETVHRDGVDFHFVAEPRLARFPSAGPAAVLPLRLARRAASLRPEVVHLNGLGFPLHLLTLARALPGVPILAQDHSNRPGRRRRLHRWALAAASGVAFTAREMADPFLAAGILSPRTPVFEVPETSASFRPGDAGAAAEAAGIHGDPALLWVGHLDRNKDPLTILDAVALALDSLPDLHLWCCFGSAPLLAEVEARLAADARLASRVHLLGRVPHERVEALCRAADFFVAASHFEGSGCALLEALACGLTPIISDIPASRALTGNGVGALVAPGDAAGFARAIVALAAGDRAEQRRRALAHFERHLSFPAVGARLLEIYQELVSSRGAR